MLALPLPVTNHVRLADWLELSALLSADGNSSAGDLERTLVSSGAMQGGAAEDVDDVAPSDAIPLKCLEVVRELELRSVAAQGAYPFNVSQSGVLQRLQGLGVFSAYTFCLCLSYIRFSHPPGWKTFPRRYFEDLAVIAAQNYIQGESVRFAAPRAALNKSFRPALDQLCGLMNEGGPYRKRKRKAGQDRKLDVVAWRHFPDRRPGKILLFGQCASGEDWEDKLGELNPDAFCKSWLVDQPISQFLRAFFIPHRTEELAWEDVCRTGGILFDRCRLAYWVHQTPAPNDNQKYVDAATALLAKLAA